MTDDERRIGTEGAWGDLRDHFIGWQCRLRQLAVRRNSGQPIAGMRPRLLDRAGNELAAGVTMLIMKEDPAASTDMFLDVCKRTLDPRERYVKALEMLAGAYFQRPREFIDVLTALFARDSALAQHLADLGECVLEFEQFSKGYSIPCRVDDLADDDSAYQATYWHNCLFNPAIPPNPRILAFVPSWAEARAAPGPEDRATRTWRRDPGARPSGGASTSGT